MNNVLEHLTDAATNLELPIRWTQVEGDPVALLTVEPPRDKHDNVLQLDALELHAEEIFLSGRTVPAEEAPKLNGGTHWPSSVAREIHARPKTQR